MTSPKKSPNKANSKRTIGKVQKEDENAKPEAEIAEDKRKDDGDATPSNKEEPTSEPASKKRKTSSAKTESAQEPKAIIEFLLSDDAFNLLDQLQTVDADGFQYPRDRHRVATRAINDLFAEENSLTSPQEVLDFGHDKVYVLFVWNWVRADDGFRLGSLHRSKTLHKDKTTSQIIGLAEVCQSTFDVDSTLSSLRDQTSHDPEAERALIVKSFKGYGPKTVDIFFRRVQVEWEEVYPFADEATLKAARGVGLDVDDAEGLRRLVDEVAGEKDDKEKRLAFARVVDVLVYLGLENKTGEVEAYVGQMFKQAT
ncbi:hypothetical protein QFC20_007042 [Naganishia adeliensis]|uniref:Uncharacterized protein n=1 Tax=Naganishia adeliensis TaxID=92952 RepID=A0ACC2V3R1_9TREE|nr:hypothetical protein QFC20_007042 [Naganishia adeliensis]